MKHPAPQINRLNGYRSRRSKKSQAAWDAAQTYSARIYRNTGLGILALSIPVWLINNRELLHFSLKWNLGVSLLFSILPPLLIRLLTETYLKNTFDEDGHHRAHAANIE